MLINIVGKTGSGKSLYNAYIAYEELTRIMNNGKKFPWYKFWKAKYSFYDYVVMNSDFNDSRGNFCKFVKSGNSCNCSVTRTNLKELSFINKFGDSIALKDHWEYGGFVIGISDLPEVFNLRNCLVLLDEGGTQFSNRDWDKMPEGYVLFLTTHRHNVTHLPKRFDIYLYTQQSDLVDITLRRLANHIYLIRPLFGYPRNPTRPYWFQRLPAIRMWSYWKHELLQGRPTVILDSDGRPVQKSAQDDLEGLEYFNWFWFPSFRKKNKYVACYNTLDHVRELKRTKGT